MGQSTEPTEAHIKSLLLTAQEMHEMYKELSRAGRHGVDDPLELIINKSEKQLVFLGTPHHSNNPERPDIPVLLKRWSEFLSTTEGKDRIVLIEGGVPRDEETQEAAVREASETGLFNFLAKKSGLDVMSTEPDWLDELLHLEKEVGRDEAIYYYFAITLRQWQCLNISVPFEEYIGIYLNRYRELPKWEDYDFSIERMVELYEQKHERKFDPATATVSKDATPGYNPAATACSEYRNVHMFREILRLWQDGKSMFIVYGSGHLIVQEKALKELLK